MVIFYIKISQNLIMEGEILNVPTSLERAIEERNFDSSKFLFFELNWILMIIASRALLDVGYK